MKMKSGWKIVLFILLISLAMVSVVSCKSTKEISVKENSISQLTYVKGQELNLSGGILIADNGKKTTEVPLDSEDVTISGYNKDVVGEQTVTIEYDKVTTQITVTVVERMVISDFVTDYLVGDSPDMSKGKIILTENDGTAKTFFLGSNLVTVSGFDSSVEKQGMDVKVTCNVGETTYEGSFKVNIHGVDEVEFHRPNKVTYNSHYSGKADISGGYLVLKGFNGTLTRTVNLTDDMVSGFDVSAVNAENTPLTQTVTVTYNGVPYTYDVKITYTDISLFKDNAKAFASINWNGETEPEIGSELGELALTLMDAFVEMSKADRALIDENDAFNVARAAMVYGFDIWADNIRLFDGAFGIEEGELVLYCESYDKVKGAIKLFEDKDSAIYTLSPLLLKIIEIYGDTVIYENETVLIRFNSYPVLDNEYLNFLSSMMEHVIDVYDAIGNLPDNWTVSDLKANGNAIEYVYIKMFSEGYVKEFPRLYYFISDWRANDDIFDILYTYFYETDQKNVMITLSSFCLPTGMEELYTYLSNAIITMNSIQSIKCSDTTDLFYNYYKALELSWKIKSQEGTLENYVYWNVPLNKLLNISSSQALDFEDMLDYILNSSCGVYDLSAGLITNAVYQQLLDKYVGIVTDISETEGYMDTAEYGKDVKELFDLYISLSPAQQYSVLSTFNSLYSIGIPELAFDDSNEIVSVFSVIINNFMRSKLSEAQAETYDNLILAIEVYANRYGYEDWRNDFTSRMNKVANALITMSDEDKQSFETYLGVAYKKYSDILNGLDNDVDLGEWSDDFDMLNAAILDSQTANYLITNGYGVYNYFFASLERASAIAKNILNNAPKNVVDAYYYKALFEMYPANSETGSAAICWSYDQAITYYRDAYVNYLLFFGSSRINVLDTYFEKNMSSFLDAYYDMVSAFMNKKDGVTTFDKAKVLAVIKQFRLLDSDSKAFFMTLESGIDMYYSALELFISEAFSKGAGDLAIKLYTLEQYYYSYQVVPNDVTLNSLKATLSQIEDMYKVLGATDKESFASLEEAYGYYIEKCEALLSSEG